MATVHGGPRQRVGGREPGSRPVAPLGCDTLVVLGEASSSGAVLFGKNSDRPPGEPQPLEMVPPAIHPPGSRLRCQWVEIPQARETARVLGSRPSWLWGFEHGLNEHGVAIGNETIFAREAPAATGLVGMDLVRLGLERATSALGAVEVIVDLVEAHGQGGSGFRDVEFPYNSSFLVADPDGAWILEVAGRHWAARRARATDSISNQVSIGSDWDRLSPDAERRLRGVAGGSVERPDFAAVYRDPDALPPVFSEGRLRRSRELLAGARGALGLRELAAILRDHAGCDRCIDPAREPDREEYYTICMHRGPSRTAASMVAALERRPRGPRIAWVAMGRPCASVYMPVPVAGELPEALRACGDEPGSGLWWVFEDIAAAVEADPAAAVEVRAEFAALEARLAAMLGVTTLEGVARGGLDRAATAFTAEVAREVGRVARGLADRLRAAAG